MDRGQMNDMIRFLRERAEDLEYAEREMIDAVVLGYQGTDGAIRRQISAGPLPDDKTQPGWAKIYAARDVYAGMIRRMCDAYGKPGTTSPNRCPICDHKPRVHGPDGCCFVGNFTTGTVETAFSCPCPMSPVEISVAS